MRREIWLVDDSPLDLRAAASALEREYRVKTFEDGSALLETLIHRAPPDLIILDWMMPGVSGIEVCRFLRSREGPQSRVAVLLLTAQHRTEQIVEGLEAGANDFVAKPYEPEELRARVRALMRARELLERAENAESTVQALLDEAPDSLLVLDDEHRVVYANREAKKLFARKVQTWHTLEGLLIEKLIPDLDLDTVAASSTTSRAARDVRVEDRQLSPTLRRIHSGGRERSMIALRDVTEQRRREARRLDFYSIIAHDLRSPLNVMVMRNEMLVGGLRGDLPKAAIEDLRKAQVNIRSMVDLINDFLDFGRLERDSFTLDRSRTDLAELINNAVTALAPLAEQKNLTIHREIDPAGSIVMGDPRRLSQVLLNLISNAIKYTDHGGSVTIAVRGGEERVELAVSDTGRGIPADILPTLFQRYVRASDTEREVVGTGLGLMIVRELVEAHGGAVGAESKLGQGSRFWFWLPRTKDDEARN